MGEVSFFSRDTITDLFLGIPLSYTLAFIADYGLAGLWCGTLASSIACCTAYAVIICRIDWPIMLLEVKEKLRLKKEKKREAQNKFTQDLRSNSYSGSASENDSSNQ